MTGDTNMIQVKLENEHTITQENKPHPLNEVLDHLWEVERLLNKIQDDYVLGEEIFEWYLVFAQEIRKFRRLGQTTDAIISER